MLQNPSSSRGSHRSGLVPDGISAARAVVFTVGPDTERASRVPLRSQRHDQRTVGKRGSFELTPGQAHLCPRVAFFLWEKDLHS